MSRRLGVRGRVCRAGAVPVYGGVSWRRGVRGRVCRAGGVPVHGGLSRRRGVRGRVCRAGGGPAYGGLNRAGRPGAETRRSGKPGGVHCEVAAGVAVRRWQGRVHAWGAREVENDCRDPPDYWTIHGLWQALAPLTFKQEKTSQPKSPIKQKNDLLPEMKMYWPDVIHPLNHSHFWKHEWEKHGTCAAQVDALNSQKKYFGGSLDLYRGLELNRFCVSVPEGNGGVPAGSHAFLLLDRRTEDRRTGDIKDALASIYGVVPKVQCLPPKQVRGAMLCFVALCLYREDRLAGGHLGGDRAASPAAPCRSLLDRVGSPRSLLAPGVPPCVFRV
ncbi:hypothetical protein GH733_000159 [Mirounga leonina]|nr:hypothetical protein GH733_000159 [Mirounga leonina]